MTSYQRRAWTGVSRSIVICARNKIRNIGKRHRRRAKVCALLQVKVIHLYWSRQVVVVEGRVIVNQVELYFINQRVCLIWSRRCGATSIEVECSRTTVGVIDICARSKQPIHGPSPTFNRNLEHIPHTVE